ncbi:DUF4259 domain-containing protein [Paenibacillus glycinis]|uniref:Bypass of forespore C C-terminal domain-containing protein n=1 Tax=Paenibacillus glycinis TaxID=2697035 RepID=A0ABW9Y157_9BACL|nr:DUF4259 domain-containing protein [Paenibacillus glycinis]NBD28196.1 hypothetical protein [Paenibacillus glycinis]
MVYVEVDLASNALGAIELLAAAHGKPGREVRDNSSLTEELEEWLADYKTEDYGNWLGVVEDLERGLRT